MKASTNQSGNFKNTMRVLFIVLTGVLFFTTTKAQDRIILNSGSEIPVKIMEITDTEVKYKTEDNLSGPTRVIPKSIVFMINYQNGTKQVFNKESKSTIGNNVLVADTDAFTPPRQRTFAGPRFGFTYITAGTISRELAKDGKNPLITQFGWQFETRLFSIENGTSGIVEFIPLIGGMEQGVFLPSANLLIGLRGGGKRAFEFALGPNLSIAGLGMVFAAGTNFRSGNINFPVNIAFVPSVSHVKTGIDANGAEYKSTVHTGFRISLTVGFNMRKK